MASISQETAKKYGLCTVAAAWLAVFCLFGYRSSFSIMQTDLRDAMGWTTTMTSIGYCVMMTMYAITAYFSGSIVDKHGTRPAYAIGAVCCFLGFFLTSFIPEDFEGRFFVYLFTYGVFAGVGTGMLWVSSTVSCRKWYVGARYGTMWGLAFMGAPMAQLLLTLLIQPILIQAGWSFGMKILSFIMIVMLFIAAAVAKRMPDYYGVEPFGLETVGKKDDDEAEKKPARLWTLGEAFKTRALWCDIGAFLFAAVGEFLVWSQVVSYFKADMGLDPTTASYIYMVIGAAGIFSMPLTGKFSDMLVTKMGVERPARRLMLIIAPVCGIIGVGLLLTKNMALCIIAMVILAIYWGIEPGGAAGYAGTVFGGASLGKIWGLATLIIMGIGPSTGTLVGAILSDVSGGSFVPSLIFGLCGYVVSLVCAIALPNKIEGEE